jgi:hypothetical protein
MATREFCSSDDPNPVVGGDAGVTVCFAVVISGDSECDDGMGGDIPVDGDDEDSIVGCSGGCVVFIKPTVTCNFVVLQNGHAFCCVLPFIGF